MKAKKTANLFALLLASALLSCGQVDSPEQNDDSAIDNTPPMAIEDAHLSFINSALEVSLSWTAPCDNSPDEKVEKYLIRYSSSFYAVSNWDFATPVFDPPIPLMPGSNQLYGGLKCKERGKNLYAAIKSEDANGNISKMSNIASIHIPGYKLLGKCVEVYQSDPISGLEVTLTAGNTFKLTTDSQGEFSKDDIYAGLIHTNISTGNASVPFHTYTSIRLVETDTSFTMPMIPFEPTQAGDFPSVLVLLKVLTQTNYAELKKTIIRKWTGLPVKCFIPPFVNSSGIDYAENAIQAASRWMDATGAELFSFISFEPDTGIVVSYRTQQEMGNLRGITYHTNTADGHPLKDTIAIADYLSDNEFVYRVFLHEFGHTIRFKHLHIPGYIMYSGQPLPSDISPDEISAVKLFNAIPDETFMGAYSEHSP